MLDKSANHYITGQILELPFEQLWSQPSKHFKGFKHGLGFLVLLAPWSESKIQTNNLGTHREGKKSLGPLLIFCWTTMHFLLPSNLSLFLDSSILLRRTARKYFCIMFCNIAGSCRCFCKSFVTTYTRKSMQIGNMSFLENA